MIKLLLIGWGFMLTLLTVWTTQYLIEKRNNVDMKRPFKIIVLTLFGISLLYSFVVYYYLS